MFLRRLPLMGFWYFGVFVVFLFSNCGIYTGDKVITKQDYEKMIGGELATQADVMKLFPVSAEDVKARVNFAIERAKIDLEKIIKMESSERTFENTIRAYDLASNRFSLATGGISVAKLVHPDKGLRDATHEAIMALSAFSIDNFLTVDIYNAFKSYLDEKSKLENLNAEQQYYLEESMRGFKHAGLHLPAAELAEVKKLQKELSDLCLEFGRNIAEDKNAIHVTKEELAGASESFINALEKDTDGKYIVRCDYPSVDEVRYHCSVGTTRRDLIRKFGSRAYPANKEILKDIIAKRDDLAHRLGFSSYAELDLDDQMAKSVSIAESFITDLARKVEQKEQMEFERLSKDLPEGVVLRDGKFEPWDTLYTGQVYKKKHFDLDDREVAEYFPVEKTIAGIFDIYQQFLNLEFTLSKPKGAWHKDVSLIEIRRRGNSIPEGYIFLDLYPRDDKYSHACNDTIVSAIKPREGTVANPSVSIVIANFPKATSDKPALLKHNDVTTFFHEFGHAMHALLGRTEMCGFSGTNTKHDFVEVPSQMFEEWMWNKEMLKRLSSHYKTGKPLSDELIDKMIELKRFDSGYFCQRQSCLSLLSLTYYKAGAKKDVEKIEKNLYRAMIKHVNADPEIHQYAAWGHLTGYAAKYYCYAWSKVIALDFFDTISKQGLLDGTVGGVLVDKVLSKGGSVDPEILVKDFLGRVSNQEAFLRDIGL